MRSGVVGNAHKFRNTSTDSDKNFQVDCGESATRNISTLSGSGYSLSMMNANTPKDVETSMKDFRPFDNGMEIRTFQVGSLEHKLRVRVSVVPKANATLRRSPAKYLWTSRNVCDSKKWRC